MSSLVCHAEAKALVVQDDLWWAHFTPLEGSTTVLLCKAIVAVQSVSSNCFHFNLFELAFCCQHCFCVSFLSIFLLTINCLALFSIFYCLLPFLHSPSPIQWQCHCNSVTAFGPNNEIIRAPSDALASELRKFINHFQFGLPPTRPQAASKGPLQDARPPSPHI